MPSKWTALICWATLVSSGCSFVMMRNPTPLPSRPRCEPTLVVPIVDAVGAAAAAFTGGSAFIGVQADDPPAGVTLGIVGVTLGVVGLLASSSVVGMRRGKRCQRAIAEWRAGSHP